MKIFTLFKKSLVVIITLLTIGVPAIWGESYEVSLANTSTTTYTKSGEISLSFSNVKKNSNGFELTNKIAGLLESSAFQDFYEGNVTWSNKKTGYSITVTKAEATFKTSISLLAYGVYGRVYAGNKSTYTDIMYRNNPTQTISISDNSGLSSAIAFTTGRNSAKGVTYLNKLKLTYSFTANKYTVNFYKEEGSTAASNKLGSATVTYDAKYSEGEGWINTPTKAGYTFLGWYKSDGTTLVKGTDVVNITAETNLFAKWKENTYTVTWPTIESGLVYTPGEIVQDHWSGGSAVDGTTTVSGTFTCSEELQPAKNSTGYIVTFTPTNSAKYLSKEGKIYGTVAKSDQYIVWNLLDGLNPKGNYYEYATGEAFDAASFAAANSAPTGLTITYTSSDESIATIVDGNKLNVKVVGQVVTITASCVDATGNWNDAATVSKTFKTCGAKPDNWSAVQGENLTYGQFLSESNLTGAVKKGETTIAGKLEWVAPNTFPSAGNNQSFEVLFTPDNQETYGSVTFNVTINVAKANPKFSWNIGTNLRSESNYSNFFSTENSEATCTIQTSNSTLLGHNGTTLTTGTVTEPTTGWIKVSQPATANFNALTVQQLNVTVNPKSNVCLPITTMDADVFANTFVEGEGGVRWCNDEFFSENIEDLLDNLHLVALNYLAVSTRHKGIQLGDWTEGLTGIDLDMESYSPKSVVLTFTGSPETISFDVKTQMVVVKKLVGIGSALIIPYVATFCDWIVEESPDNQNYTQVGDKVKSRDTQISRSLKPETRYVKITYSGNFAGFVRNLQITKCNPYMTVTPTALTFGTNEHPLQDPQAVTINYGALGECGQTGAITASIDNPHFYLDETNITDNVGFDYNGNYTVRVRCNEVGQTGTLTFTAFDGTKKTVALTSNTPELTNSGSTIFATGTEHAQTAGMAYRTKTTVDYTQCFDGSNAKFDTLYIYGVSESTAANRLWEMDMVKGYKVPALNVADGNVYTPCFVYKKNNNKYVYARTCDATKILNITASGKKLGFIGYRPASTAITADAIQLNGAAGEQTELYLNNTEVVANGIVLKTNSSSAAEPFAVKIYARGTNIMSANAAAVKMSGNICLTIEDSWKNDAVSGILALRSASGYPSVDLGGENSVIVNGTQLELHNAIKMAIVHMDGTTEKTDGIVRINDGTIIGESILGMPQNTLIDGGTFNQGTVVCFNNKGKQIRPFNSRGDVLARQTMLYAELPDWYGKAHLTLDGADVHPMLLGGEGLCIFEATQNSNSSIDINWSTAPEATSDAIIAQNMEVIGTLEVKSLTINEGVTVTVKEGSKLIINDGDSFREIAGDLHVATGGHVLLSTGTLNVRNFILDAALGTTNEIYTSPSSSGQVTEEENLHIDGDAYFRLTLDPSGRNTLGWYDFVLPFAVDVIGGISIAGDEDTPMQFNVNYAVMEYSEAKRAVNGKCWNKFRGTMEPGKVYTITLDEENPNWNTVIFKKKAGAQVTGDRSYTTEYSSNTGEEKDRGWNGFGNATLHHTELNVQEGTLIQMYDHTNRCYQAREAKDYTIPVGLSFFMQFDEVKTITLDPAVGNSQFRAPKRSTRQVSKFRLALKEEGAENAVDNLWVSANEEATGEYVIGQDVLKMGTINESKVARMWSVRNDVNLCSNDMPMKDNKAEGALGLYAPKTGYYTLEVESAPEDATLYLTYNGDVIWNLSVSPYMFDLSEGTTNAYGLRMVAKVPQVATGMESANAESATMCKVIIDNKVYIVTPEGKMYDVIGKCVKY